MVRSDASHERVKLAATPGGDDLDLEAKLAAIDAIAQYDYRTANVRAGYVYVISNRGAFGDHVVKIALTRRLEPMDRVHELGDASVQFRFDVHALFFSEDAVTLEAELHQHFGDRRVNAANNRREFFFGTPADVRDVLAAKGRQPPRVHRGRGINRVPPECPLLARRRASRSDGRDVVALTPPR